LHQCSANWNFQWRQCGRYGTADTHRVLSLGLSKITESPESPSIGFEEFPRNHNVVLLIYVIINFNVNFFLVIKDSDLRNDIIPSSEMLFHCWQLRQVQHPRTCDSLKKIVIISFLILSNSRKHGIGTQIPISSIHMYSTVSTHSPSCSPLSHILSLSLTHTPHIYSSSLSLFHNTQTIQRRLSTHNWETLLKWIKCWLIFFPQIMGVNCPAVEMTIESTVEQSPLDGGFVKENCLKSNRNWQTEIV